jgi:ribA/ribD-fused uncharacterized protein
MEEINFYRRKEEYGWLSNFERTPVLVAGTIYQTNEHYYQSMKSKNPFLREWIENAPTPYYAMIAGRSLKLEDHVDNWYIKKADVMKRGIRAKFKNSVLRQKLLDTEDAILHEDSPTDIFWGKKGKDMLGKLLMEVREEIKKETK